MRSAVILALAVAGLGAQAATELSKKAASLKMGMSREAVIKLLGPATWASVPGDKGEFALPDPDIALELRWKNPGCTPVAVSFDGQHRANGWDEGRLCMGGADGFNPSEEYSCSKKDRRELCGVPG